MTYTFINSNTQPTFLYWELLWVSMTDDKEFLNHYCFLQLSCTKWMEKQTYTTSDCQI